MATVEKEEVPVVTMVAAECHAVAPTRKRDAVECRLVDEECDGEQPCAKRPKLSKKEMLEQAKARLKEAQEKKQQLQQKLEEEKAKEEQELQEPEQEEYDEFAYAEDYYYEYHIPPVTGAKENLFVKDIDSTGPADKVRFIEDTNSFIESLLKVMEDRKRSLSPVNAAGFLSAPWVPPNQQANPQGPPTNAANPQGPPPPPPPPPPHVQESKSRESSNSSSMKPGPGEPHPRDQHMRDQHHPPPPQRHNQNPNSRRDGFPPGGRDRHPQMPVERDRHSQTPVERDRRSQMPVERDRSQMPVERDRHQLSGERERERPRSPQQQQQNSSKSNPMRELRPLSDDRPGSATNPMRQIRPLSDHHNVGGGAKQPPGPLQGKEKLRLGAPLASQRDPPKPPPPRLPGRPCKLALAQITGKALDCSIDLPTKTQYLIRTQTQGIVAFVQFFSSPSNPVLLEHHPSKRHIQDHFQIVPRLPCNATQAWKAEDILSFLKNQDERRTRTTYLPPARRNLPLSHWALLDLEQPLYQTAESPGYFTAALETPKLKNASPGNNEKKEISFAGKLVWNMHDFYQQQPDPTTGRRNTKLSKWGEVVSAQATTGIRNGPLIATIQGFYEIPMKPQQALVMPQALRARKVILPKSRSIGIVIGMNTKLSESAATGDNNSNSNSNNKGGPNNNAGNAPMGSCQVLFPNGIANGPAAVQALKGSRAIMYD